MTGIYKIENKNNGKLYIGQSTDFRCRKARHRFDLRNNKHVNQYMQNDFNEDNECFSYELIYECPPLLLNLFEEIFMHSFEREKLYNKELKSSRYGKRSEEICKRISNAKKGCTQNLTDEQRKKISERLKSAVFSDEHRKKLSKGRTGKTQTPEARALIIASRKAMTPEIILEIRKLASEGMTTNKLMEAFKLKRPVVNNIIARRTWTNI